MVTFNEALAAGKVTSEEACQIFDSLPAAKPNELIGLWKGQSFPSGSSMDGSLEKSGWYGKQFIDDNSVHPLVFKSNNSGRFVADPVKVVGISDKNTYVPDVQSKVETEQPKARIRVVEYRGVPTASMVYNELPVIDHFRKAADDTLLGAMDNPRLPDTYFFVLRRQSSNL